MRKILAYMVYVALLCIASNTYAAVPIPNQIPPMVRYEQETRVAAQCLINTAGLKEGTRDEVWEGSKHFSRTLVPVDKRIDEWRIEFYPGLREGYLPGTTKEDIAKIDACMKDLDPPPYEPDVWFKGQEPTD